MTDSPQSRIQRAYTKAWKDLKNAYRRLHKMVTRDGGKITMDIKWQSDARCH